MAIVRWDPARDLASMEIDRLKSLGQVSRKCESFLNKIDGLRSIERLRQFSLG